MPEKSPQPRVRLVAENASVEPPQLVRDDDSEAYLIELGQRVRRMRAIRGMSRKVVAKASGVSERYIAQLESGRGNISIMLLRRVAAATGTPIEDLVADSQRLPPSWPLIRDMVGQASPEVVEEVKTLLQNALSSSPAPLRQPAPSHRVALIGLRGAGKSTLGQLAATQFGWPFVELNKEIERENGLSITEIFSLYGQKGFRRLELAALKKVIARPGPMMLATGGGIVAEAVTFELLLASFFTIWVTASPAEHMSRVRQQGDLRPMANDNAAMVELIAILSSREPLYARAKKTLRTSGAPVEKSLKQLIEIVHSEVALG
jgi:XRE family aerobic/anaerobic benzoate catabolism transcriptional regulator